MRYPFKPIRGFWSRPKYIGRHIGRDFLVLGNGPTLNLYRETLYQIIKEKNLIVMGVNNIRDFVVPDYHAFGNKKTFERDAYTIEPDVSRVLMGKNIPRNVIKRNYPGPFERIHYRQSTDCFDIKNGIIFGADRTTTGLLIAVAIVMGARQIYVAGMDGYSRYVEEGGNPWHHSMPTNNRGFKGYDTYGRDYYKALDDAAYTDLQNIRNYQLQKEMKVFQFVTPSTYEI